MADLRIVDAPLLSTVKGTEKIPTGGEGNFSVSVNQVADFAKLKWVLATEGYVDNAVGNVQSNLNLHKNNVSNPHQVTKAQVGLSNVDNTADLDKPISNANIAALSLKADKIQVTSDLNVKADKVYVDSAVGAISTDASKQYATLALANSDIANIPLNKNMFISEAVNGGYWYKATAGATSLTKSPYDPLTQAKSYTDESLKVVASDSSLVHKNLAKNADFSEGYNGIITLPSSGSGGFNAAYPQIPNYYVLKSGANDFATQVRLIDDYWKIGSKKSVEISINKVGATAQDLHLYNIVDIPPELIGKTDIDLTVCIPYVNNNSNITILAIAQKSADKNNIGAYTPVAVNQKYPSKVGVTDTLIFTAKITDTSAKYIAVAIRALANSADVTSSVKVGAFSVYFDRPNVEKYEPSVYAQDTALINLTKFSFPNISDPTLNMQNKLFNANLLDSQIGSNSAPNSWSVASGGAGTVAGVSTITATESLLKNNNNNRIFSVAHYNNGTVRTDKQLAQTIEIPTYLINSGKKVRFIQWCKRSSSLVDFSMVCRWKTGNTQLLQFAPTTVVDQAIAGEWCAMVWETTLNMANATHLEILYRTQVSASSGIISGITTQQTLFAVFLDAALQTSYDRNFDNDVSRIAEDTTNSILNSYVPPAPYDNDLYTNSLGDLEKAFPNKTLINMGDSQFNSLYTQLSAAFTDRTVINGGVGGERTDQILGRLDGAANHTNTTGWTNGQTVKLKAGLVPVSRESEVSYRAQWADWLKFRAAPQKISFMRNGTRIASAYSTNRRTVTATVSGTTFTAAGHGFELWDRITPNSVTLPSGMVKDKVYWVRDVTADTFTLAENYQGGNAVTWPASAGNIDFLSEYEVSWIYDGAGTTITSTINSSWDYSTMLIGGGTNDIVLSKTFAEITTNIRACVNHGKTLHKRVIVSGIPGFYESADDAGWKIGGAKYNLMMKVNSWIKQEYPLNYVDPYAMLLNSGDGSASDNADIAVGLVPRSLRVSATDGHINEAGNTLRVNQIKDLMTALRW